MSTLLSECQTLYAIAKHLQQAIYLINHPGIFSIDLMNVTKQFFFA